MQKVVPANVHFKDATSFVQEEFNGHISHCTRKLSKEYDDDADGNSIVENGDKSTLGISQFTKTCSIL